MGADGSPMKRRRFLQGSAAAAFVVGLPFRASRSSAPTPSCDPIRTEPHFTGSVPSPVDVLGFALGVEREVTAAESNAYVDAVAAASDRVTSGTCAVSVQGRDIRYAIVGLPEHVTDQGLAAIQADIARIRDPQTPTADVGELAQTTPAILWVEGSIHGNEESGCDTALQLLYELADRDDCVVEQILANAIVVLVPCQNPDGREADTRRNAYGFDLNRDVFARTQPETEGRVELMRRYPPVLLLDHHEFGYYRSFFPPNSDPIYHDVGEQQITWIEDVYGAAISAEFVRQDEDFFHGGVYDFFAPQFNDTGATLGMGAAGLTLEVYNGAPLDRRFHRQSTIAWVCLAQAAIRKPKILRQWHRSFVTAVDEGRRGELERNRRYFFRDRPIRTAVPRAPVRQYFILDRDPAKHADVQRLVRRLQRMDVRVFRLDEPLTVSDFTPYTRDPRHDVLPAGTHWVPMAQPQKHWIQALLNEDPYMPTNYTYGLSGWSNPLLMNLDGGFSGAVLDPVATLEDLVDEPAPPTLPSTLPRVGLYQMSFGSYAVESCGATRWLFDTRWHLPFVEIETAGILAGALDDIDVLVAPGGDFPTALRKLGDAGADALVDWVNAGGRYVGYRGGGAKLAAAIGLTTAVMRDPSASIPGSVVRVAVDRSSPLGDGIGDFVWLLFDDDDVVVHAAPGTAPLWFPTGASGDFFVSGFSYGEAQMFGTAAVVDESVGGGRVVLMPSDPNARGHSEGMSRVLWNAVLGPDPAPRSAALEARAPGRAAAEWIARDAVLSRPHWEGALRLTVPDDDRTVAASMLRRHGARFIVRRAGGRSRFTIENPDELSYEEHPWAIQFSLELRRSGIDVLAFSVP